MTPIAASIATLATLCVVLSMHVPVNRFLYIALMTLAATILSRRFTSIRLATFWLVLFCGPLFAMHGILNTQYAVTSKLFNTIPLRDSGLVYAFEIASFIMLLFVPSIFWFQVKRDDTLSFLSKVRTPKVLLLILFQAVSISSLLLVRANTILMAQKARGINIGSGLISRFTSVLPVFVPLVATIIREVDTRSRIQDYLPPLKTIDAPHQGKMFSVWEVVVVFVTLTLWAYFSWRLNFL